MSQFSENQVNTKPEQNFVNPAFADIFNGITRLMPQITFFGIIATYVITAGLNVYTIPLPWVVSIPTALAIQYGRFAVVFKNFLNPLGFRSRVPEVIATIATLFGIAELAYSLLHMGMKDNHFFSVFLFGMMVIAFGYILEVGFIDEGAKAFGMRHRSKVQGAYSPMVATQPTQQTEQVIKQVEADPLKEKYEDLLAEMELLKAQILEMGNAESRPTEKNGRRARLSVQPAGSLS